MLHRYTCGHIGREAGRKNAKAFVRVAEIRSQKVEDEKSSCPNCKGK
jgi:hypothetical protein